VELDTKVVNHYNDTVVVIVAAPSLQRPSVVLLEATTRNPIHPTNENELVLR
jgi:hypothetical protein